MIVVDASVAVKWFLIEPETPQAIEIARKILAGADVFAVPELFFYEVFAVVMRKHEKPSEWASAGMLWLLNLPIQRMNMTRELSQEMASLIKQGLTGYDAAYAALARQYHGKWLTFDRGAAIMLGSPEWIVSTLE